MKLLFLIPVLCISLTLSGQTGTKDIFIREIDFKLEEISDNEYENEYFITLNLNNGSLYKFVIQNHIGDFKGEAVVSIYDNDKSLASNYIGDNYYDEFHFKCTKTGFYDVIINFRENNLGSSIIRVFMVQ